MSDRDESDRNEWIYGQLTARIDSEFDRLANRMTWLIGANAFLFTGFLISLSGVSRADMAMGGMERLVALSIVAGIGLYVCYVSYMSMAVARWVIAGMKDHRQVYERKMLEPLGIDFSFTFPNGGGQRLGNMIYRNVPMAFGATWMLLLTVAVSALVRPSVSVMFLVACAGAWRLVMRPYIERSIDSMQKTLN